MIRFTRIELEHVALWESLTLTFSTNPDQPLTFIRGENESGKTTLFRVITWLLFDAAAVPTMIDKRSGVELDPLRYDGAGATASTAVGRLFLEDVGPDGQVRKSYMIQRSLATKINGAGRPVRDDVPEGTVLKEERKGKLVPVPDGLKKFANTYFRDEMRDFYVIDADKADRYVGGPEGMHDDSLMEASVTAAMRSLLGIDTMVRVIDRLEKIRGELRTKAGNKSDDKALQDLSTQEQTAREGSAALTVQIEEWEQKLHAARGRESSLVEGQHQASLKNKEYRDLTEQIERAGSQLRSIEAEINSRLEAAMEELHSPAPYRALARRALGRLNTDFEGLRQNNALPRSEVTLLPTLLRKGVCVCGERVDEAGGVAAQKRHKHISDLYTESQAFHTEATLLQRISVQIDPIDADSTSFGTGRKWADGIDDILGDIDTDRDAALDLTTTIQDLVERRDLLPPPEDDNFAAELVVLVANIAEYETKIEKALAERAKHKSDLESATKKLATHKSNKVRAAEELNAVAATSHILDALRRALETIANDRVKDVSELMNTAFRQIADGDEEADGGLGMTSEVGIEIIGEESAAHLRYGLFARNHRGIIKPLQSVNGANRRALAISFVLALAQVSENTPPLVADSLFHATSGSVKRKLAKHIISSAAQPILFGTRSDVIDPEADLRSLIVPSAGVSYTLSNVRAGELRHPDVASLLKTTAGVAVCTCDVAHVCPACERKGDKERGNYTHHNASQTVN